MPKLKHLILVVVAVAITPPLFAQLKFGVAAGYEHIHSNAIIDMNSAGGFAGSLLLQGRLSPHWELDGSFTIASMKMQPFYSSYYRSEPRGSAPPPGYVPPQLPPDGKGTLTHVVAPVHVCYVLPVRQYELFMGPGFFWSTSDAGGNSRTGIMRSYGISTLAGARWHHWQVTAEYRPWLHIYNWHSDNDNFLTNDLSIKAGFLFGRLHRRPTN